MRRSKARHHAFNTFIAAICLLAVAPTVTAKPSTSDRPNILFIMTDQQFAEVMSCRMGDQYIRTPAMDSLARSGTVFTRAYSANPLCMPSRNSIFTGYYPHQTGVTKNGRMRFDSKKFLSMGNHFRRAGYETAYFGKWHLCFDRNKLEEHGFQTAECLHGKGYDAEVADLAVEYLRRKKGPQDKPFLLVVSLSNPHDVCQLARGQRLPSGPVGSPPPPEECPPPPANPDLPENESDTIALLRKGYHADPKFPVGNFTENQWRQLRWGYYRIVEKVDAEIGKVLKALRGSNLEDETLIVFTSDHGECAGAHGFNQKTVFYEESARVPLIISFKGKSLAATSDRLVNTGIDILPTLLDFAGIPVPEKLPGRSLRPIALGKSPSAWRDHVVAQNNMCQTGQVDGVRPVAQGRMVRTQRFKYCVYEYGIQRESLFDMQADPIEKRNLAADPAYRPVLLKHRRILSGFADKHKDKMARKILAEDVAARPFSGGR